jgi:hypothetical protein
VAFHKPGSAIELPPVPPAQLDGQKSHALSVAIDAATGEAIATHPDGNCVSLWNVKERSLLAQFPVALPQGCVVSPDGRGFVVTSLRGQTLQILTGPPRVQTLPATANGSSWKHALLWSFA